MKHLFGDVHNHCGITYGFGGLKNALDNAKTHLDFVAITGHAFWPDMPKPDERTAFLVNFHKEGFAKLEQNYPQIKDDIKSYNKEGQFTTFYSYEMHSSKYGDYHLVSGSDEIPLLKAATPEDWAKLVYKYPNTIIIPHHIAYTPNYRGINWDLHDENIAPAVEVCSKHGCSMSDSHPNNYYHNMGCRDARNTVYAGLEKGKKIGFVGSTDHHAGYPGSYGDCKVCVVCENNTREDIMNALKARRCYAVTADRIIADFSVNGHKFGSIVKEKSDTRTIKYKVETSDYLDKMIVYKNLKPMKIINGEYLDVINQTGIYKIRIEFGWGNIVGLYNWNFEIHTTGGKIVGLEKCFRGRSVLAPQQGQNISEDVNVIENHADITSETSVSGVVQTAKNTNTTSPATSAVVLTVEGDLQTVIKVEVNGLLETHKIGELIKSSYSRPMFESNSQCFKIHKAVSKSQFEIEGEICDNDCEDKDFYHMEVFQKNGSMAFVSPVYFEVE